MKNSSQYYDAVLLIARVGLSLVFILSGLMKFTDLSGTAGYIASVSLPSPALFAFLAALVETVAGLFILVGFKARLSAWALVVFVLLATVFFHIDFADQLQTTMLLKNLAIVGGLLYVAVCGAGVWSADEKMIPKTQKEPFA